MSAPERIPALMGRLGSSGPLRHDVVAIPGTSTRLRITRPSDIDLLLDQVADDPEQNLPYWAEIWPSGIALAATIARRPDLVCGLRVLEIGCGVGLTAAIALDAGGDVLATDYAPESLILTQLTCLQHVGKEPRVLRVNWRDPGSAILSDAPGGYPVVLAADVLYERRDIEPLLALMERIVAPDGLFWLAEPGRAPAAHFVQEAARRGWSHATETWDGPWPDPGDAGVIVRIHQLRRQTTAGCS